MEALCSTENTTYFMIFFLISRTTKQPMQMEMIPGSYPIQ